MADIDVVIKIPEEKYNEIYSLKFVQYGLQSEENKKFFYLLINAIQDGTLLPKCKHCKHFERDVVALVDGIPLIVGHEMCNKWGDGCKTQEDGYCFLFEPIEN